MIHCLRCHKQYIGETKRRLKDRFNGHWRPVDRPTPSSRPTAFSDHFLSDNHSSDDMELIPLERFPGKAGSRIEDGGSRIEDRGSRIEDRGSRIEGRGSGIKDRGSRIKDRGSRIEDRGSTDTHTHTHTHRQ